MTDQSPDESPPFNPYLALIIGTMAVSTGAIFARLADALIIGTMAVSTGAIFARLADAPALVIAAYRVGIASLILAPATWWKARDEIA
jgi:hypothetical protein